jgi:Flp pilus assembly pilin Flp
MERVYALILDDNAASSVEYSILVTGIALVVLGAIYGIGTQVLNTLYNPALNMFH